MTYDSPASFDEVLSKIIFKIKFTTSSNQLVELDARAILDIDYDNLITDLQKSPRLYSEWANLYAEAKYVYDAFDSSIKARRGVAMNELMAQFSDSKSSVKLTDRIIQYMVEADPVILKFEQAKNKMNRAVIKLYHTVKALDNKIEVMRSLAGFKKTEQNSV